MRTISPPKKYVRYTSPDGRKLYAPVYNHSVIMFSTFPAKRWLYTTATEANAHATRYADRKLRQNVRFSDEKYKQRVLERYGKLVKVYIDRVAQDEKTKGKENDE